LSLSNLFEAANRVFRIGPRVQYDLFDGGRARQQIEVQNAVQEQALVAYERAILTALEDVENAISAFTKEQLRHVSLQAASESASRAAQLAEARFEAGDTDYLSVLDAQRSRLAAQDELAQSEGQITTALVRLYKALGGGWNPEEAREEDEPGAGT
jgi:outer membrane protein TolC